VLTVVQFGIVVFLTGFSMMIGRQLRFMDHKDLGYTSENVYITRIPSREPRGSFLLEEIRRDPSVVSERHFPGRQHDGFLLSGMLKNKYASSRKLALIIRVFTLLSVLIAGFGLYGLSLYITQQRTKEIGIRKVFGASQWQVNSMLNLGFLKWVAISFAVACPVTLWALKKWLMNFAYKATQSAWIFLLTGIMVTAIAVVSVTWQTLSAARRNPVDSIRYE
jgi:putative ABC transport system permease protein